MGNSSKSKVYCSITCVPTQTKCCAPSKAISRRIQCTARQHPDIEQVTVRCKARTKIMLHIYKYEQRRTSSKSFRGRMMTPLSLKQTPAPVVAQQRANPKNWTPGHSSHWSVPPHSTTTGPSNVRGLSMFGRTSGSSSDDTSMSVSWNASARLLRLVRTGPVPTRQPANPHPDSRRFSTYELFEISMGSPLPPSLCPNPTRAADLPATKPCAVLLGETNSSHRSAHTGASWRSGTEDPNLPASKRLVSSPQVFFFFTTSFLTITQRQKIPHALMNAQVPGIRQHLSRGWSVTVGTDAAPALQLHCDHLECHACLARTLCGG